jgi:hypothetical protein
MTKLLERGAKVRVTNIMGHTEDTEVEWNFQLIGQEGFVQEVHGESWVNVILPENRYYATGKGALLRPEEVELL